jgi:hypothetical protein
MAITRIGCLFRRIEIGPDPFPGEHHFSKIGERAREVGGTLRRESEVWDGRTARLSIG